MRPGPGLKSRRGRVEARGALRYRAEGLLLHMPGRWRFMFDLALDDGVRGDPARAVVLNRG